MLKPADPPPQPDDERPVGELVHQLIEDGKAYVTSEVALYKAMATAKGRALAMPAALLGAAFLLLQAAVTVLAVATFLALLPLIGPFFAGVLAFLIFTGAAGGLGYWAVQKVRSGL